MKRVQGSKSIICSKKELNMIIPFTDFYYIHIYELPLFTLRPKDMHHEIDDIQTDFVLIRTVDAKLSERFMNNINKAWNSLYEGWY